MEYYEIAKSLNWIESKVYETGLVSVKYHPEVGV
jgi:hypothetical protein